MIPQPPFAGDLTLEQELEAFRALKPRLTEVWEALTAADDSHCTSVVVPSLTLDQGELSKLAGVAYYEERLLFLLIRLRNPRAHVVYVTSQPVHPMILDYYLNLLAGVPAAHARARLTMLCCHDGSPRPLTEKIIERPRLMQRIREAIPDPKRAYLTVFNSTRLERKLSVLLGIPLNGLDPDLQYYGTKSGSRRVFRQAGVACPEGFEDLHTEEDVIKGLTELQRKRPGVRRAIVKLNESFSGEGNAVFTYPSDAGGMAGALANVGLPTADVDRSVFFDEYRRMGGVVEEYVESPEKHSPSVQLRTSPTGLGTITSATDSKMPMYGIGGLETRMGDAHNMGGMQKKLVFNLGRLVLHERTDGREPYDGEFWGWSPAELNRVAYVDGKGDLWVARADGRDAQRILKGQFSLPAWSDDGKAIAVAERKDNGRQWDISVILLPEPLRSVR